MRIHLLYALECNLPNFWISWSATPFMAVVVAAPIRKLWDLCFDTSKPKPRKHILSCCEKNCLDTGQLSGNWNNSPCSYIFPWYIWLKWLLCMAVWKYFLWNLLRFTSQNCLPVWDIYLQSDNVKYDYSFDP